LVNEAEADLIAGPAMTEAAAAPPPKMTIRELLQSIQPEALPNFICLNIQTILSTFADNIYSNWIALFLAEVYLLSEERIGLLNALPLLGGAAAGLVGGILNDYCIWLTGNPRWSRRAIAGCGKGLAAVLLLTALAFYRDPYTFCCLLFFVKFFGDWSLATSWGVITDIGGRATASVFAFNNTIAGLGLIAAPPIFGKLADHYGWPPVFVVVAAAYVLCALSWLGIDCTRPLIREK
jgi:MFS family permease